jgi:hypothetical protein
LWGIYHSDWEFAGTLDDPLRTTVEAPTKIAAEEAAAKLGFSKPLAHPNAPKVAELAVRILKSQPEYRQEGRRKSSRAIHI